MKKFNKNLISSIFLMVILQLVAPLLAYAESGNSLLRINTNFTDENSKQIVVDCVDYWKVPDGKIENIEKPEKQLELINSYKDKYDEEISKDLGEMKSSNKSEEKNGMAFALIEGLEKGVYLLRYRSNDPSRPFIPFLAIIDENTENPLTIYPKKAPDTLTLTKRDKDDTTKVLSGVGFNVINKKGEILKFNKIKDDKGNEQLTYSPNGKITEIFTDQKGQIKLFGLEEEVKFKETKPLKGYEKNVGKESEFKRSGSIELLNEKDKPENYFSFQKIDGTNNDPLKGAIFKVQEKTKDGYKDLEENGKVYTLTSSENGEFKTKNLPYGDYRLIETKAPQGYVPELDAVDFTIGETSSNKTIKVKNYKPTTPGPKGGNNRLSKRVDAMAKTGDATIYLILLLGLLMIGVGVKFVRAKE